MSTIGQIKGEVLSASGGMLPRELIPLYRDLNVRGQQGDHLSLSNAETEWFRNWYKAVMPFQPPTFER